MKEAFITGVTAVVEIPVSALPIRGDRQKSLLRGFADVKLVQDGYAWFEHFGCKVAHH